MPRTAIDHILQCLSLFSMKRAPSTGLEPVHPAPEADALSTELRGPKPVVLYHTGEHEGKVE